MYIIVFIKLLLINKYGEKAPRKQNLVQTPLNTLIGHAGLSAVYEYGIS